MQRAASGFHQDADGDWVVDLCCGHAQHARHDPPFTLRPWVTTAGGRASKLGEPFDCVRCDRFELPEGLVTTRHTADFTESTVPAGLLRDHTTKAGTWARIVVTEGSLRYVVESLARAEVLTSAAPGIVVPELPHHIEPLGAVRFHLELLRVPDAG